MSSISNSMKREQVPCVWYWYFMMMLFELGCKDSEKEGMRKVLPGSYFPFLNLKYIISAITFITFS